ncbi:MAG TPA: hypothetical protein DCR93_35945 [Cytophagales bacterium]|nr:hypothetical protein [Cytophagales bacterium]
MGTQSSGERATQAVQLDLQGVPYTRHTSYTFSPEAMAWANEDEVLLKTEGFDSYLRIELGGIMKE